MTEKIIIGEVLPALVHSAALSRIDDCKEMYRKLNAIAPYNTPSNLDYGNPNYAKTLREKHPVDIRNQAQFELGLLAAIPVPVAPVAAPINPQMVTEQPKEIGGQATSDLINEWEYAKDEALLWKNKEMELRKRVAATYFVDPKEGANKADDSVRGVKVAGDYKINRKIDQKMVSIVQDKLKEYLGDEPIPVWFKEGKVELKLREYKALSPEVKLIVDLAVSSTMGSPTIKLTKIAEVQA
jgi:hypothetical protein